MNPDFCIIIFTFSLLKPRHTLLNSGVGQSQRADTSQVCMGPKPRATQRRRRTELPWEPGSPLGATRAEAALGVGTSPVRDGRGPLRASTGTGLRLSLLHFEVLCCLKIYPNNGGRGLVEIWGNNYLPEKL